MNRNLSLLADFYEFTMANGFFAKNMTQKNAYFDVFFRKVPDSGGYVIFAGLEQIIEYINNLKFTNEDIEFLRKTNKFSNLDLFTLVIVAPLLPTPSKSVFIRFIVE